MNYPFLALPLGFWVLAMGCFPVKVIKDEERISSPAWNFAIHPASLATLGVFGVWGLSKLAYETIPPIKKAVHGNEWYNRALTWVFTPYDRLKYRNDKKLVSILNKRGPGAAKARDMGKPQYEAYRAMEQRGVNLYNGLSEKAKAIFEDYINNWSPDGVGTFLENSEKVIAIANKLDNEGEEDMCFAYPHGCLEAYSFPGAKGNELQMVKNFIFLVNSPFYLDEKIALARIKD